MHNYYQTIISFFKRVLANIVVGQGLSQRVTKKRGGKADKNSVMSTSYPKQQYPPGYEIPKRDTHTGKAMYNNDTERKLVTILQLII